MLEQQIYKETLATTCAEEAVCTGGTQGPFWALGAKGLAAFKVEKCPMCSLGSEEPILVAFFFFFSPLFKPWEHNSNPSYRSRILSGPFLTEICSQPLQIKGPE